MCFLVDFCRFLVSSNHHGFFSWVVSEFVSQHGEKATFWSSLAVDDGELKFVMHARC